MNKKQFEEMFKQEIDSIEIKSFKFDTPIQTAQHQQKAPTKSWKLMFSSLTTAVAVLCIMIFVYLPTFGTSQITSYIFEINPSICVTANSDNQVLAVCSLNADGDTVLSDTAFSNLKDMSLEDCVMAFVSVVNEKGFFENYQDTIKIYAVNNKNELAKEKAEIVEDILRKDLESQNLKDIPIKSGFMELEQFKERMQFENDFNDLDKFKDELEGRKFFDPSLSPPPSKN